MTRQGLIVVESGDVRRAAQEDLKYSSETQSLKVLMPMKGLVQLSPKGYARIVMQHNLGYRPIAQGYYRIGTDRWKMMENSAVAVYSSNNTTTIELLDYGSDTVPLNLQNATFQYKVWIFTDPAQGVY